MKKTITALAIFALIGLLAGCGTTPISPAWVTTVVRTGVSFGIDKYPQAVPYVRVATPIICAAANSTNIQPAQVVSALQNAGVTNPEAVGIINGALAVYDTIFDSYGSNWLSNQTALQGYLGAVCNGMTEALPSSAKKAALLPPHLR